MKRFFAGALFLALFVAGTSCAATYGQTGMRTPPAGPGAQIGISYFYDNLSDDGEWFQDASLGWCWTPYDVAEDWRPYSLGHWEYSDYGWSWASDETFGWATYHYGRWFFDDNYGWAWVPGYDWAPAWVAWRTGDDYIGWAPLPPRANWDASAGLTFGDADANAIPPTQWAFVPRQHLLDVNLSLQLTSEARNVTLIDRSHDATRFEMREGHPADLGLDVAQFEIALGHPVTRVRIVDADTPDHARQRIAVSGSIGFFRPNVQPVPIAQVPPPSRAGHRVMLPDATMQIEREQRGRQLETDLTAERGRLALEHQKELAGQVPGVAADETRKRQATEQQAFEAHAIQQRQVLAQRMQKQVMRPDNGGKPGKGNNKPDKPGNGNGKDKGHGNGGQ